MRISKKALEAINNVEFRMKIALALGVTEQTIKRYIKLEDDCLTKVAAIAEIKELTGLSEEEIIETENQHS